MDRRRFFMCSAAVAATVPLCPRLLEPPKIETHLRMYENGVFLLKNGIAPEPYDEDDGMWHSLVRVRDHSWLDGYTEEHPDQKYILPGLGYRFSEFDWREFLKGGSLGYVWHKDFGFVRLGAVLYRMV